VFFHFLFNFELCRYAIAGQAARGMFFLHSKNIVHGDLSSLNLVLDSEFNVLISGKSIFTLIRRGFLF